MSILSEVVRGTHFLVSYFGLAPLVNRRFLLAWNRGGPCAARDIFRAHCDRALKIAGADVTVEGEHHIPSEGCVLVYNEASLLDLVLLQRYVFEHANIGVAAEVFAKLPWTRETFAKSGIVIFQRGDRAKVERMLAVVTEQVAQGAKLAMGGEGRLTPDGSVGHFKRGGCLVAIRARAPVVPVALSGGPSMMTVGSLRLRPGKLWVTYGEPIATVGLAEDAAEQLAARVRERVVALRR
ncbi:MAG: lysophospholipid acyltransferase family protein [Rhodoferax sp.]|nr:lysophospholipid acyltransferase family protein [Rhodoferax sp.]